MGVVARPLAVGKGGPQGRALAFPQDQNKGGSKGGYQMKPKNPIRDPKVSKLHPRDTGPHTRTLPRSHA